MPAETVVALKAHLAINVRNVAQSMEFYRKMFGIEPSKVRSGYAKFDVQNPPLNFTLNEVPFKDAGALSHMGLAQVWLLATRCKPTVAMRRRIRRGCMIPMAMSGRSS
jgi:hypothetical protein